MQVKIEAVYPVSKDVIELSPWLKVEDTRNRESKALHKWNREFNKPEVSLTLLIQCKHGHSTTKNTTSFTLPFFLTN